MGEERLEALDPCPFCGREAVRYVERHEGLVGCANCGIKKRPHSWNRRALTEPTEDAVAPSQWIVLFQYTSLHDDTWELGGRFDTKEEASSCAIRYVHKWNADQAVAIPLVPDTSREIKIRRPEPEADQERELEEALKEAARREDVMVRYLMGALSKVGRMVEGGYPPYEVRLFVDEMLTEAKNRTPLIDPDQAYRLAHDAAQDGPEQAGDPARAIRLLDAWLADQSGYDEEAWAEIKDAIRRLERAPLAYEGEDGELRRRDVAWAMAVGAEDPEVAQRIAERQIELRTKHPEWLERREGEDG